MCSRNSSASPDSLWISRSDCSHWCVFSCTSFVSSSALLYIQCEATPASATLCISGVRIWISIGMPKGPKSVVCSDW